MCKRLTKTPSQNVLTIWKFKKKICEKFGNMSFMMIQSIEMKFEI